MKKHNVYLANELTGDIRLFNPKKIAQHVVENKLIKDLIQLCFSHDHLICSRAAWILWFCFELDKKMVIPYVGQLIDNLNNKNIHHAVIRNTLRLFQQQPVPPNHESKMLDMCYKYIQDSSQTIAVRAFAMTVNFNICKSYPELLVELKSILQHLNHPEESPGIKSRIKNTLLNIDKLLTKKV